MIRRSHLLNLRLPIHIKSSNLLRKGLLLKKIPTEDFLKQLIKLSKISALKGRIDPGLKPRKPALLRSRLSRGKPKVERLQHAIGHGVPCLFIKHRILLQTRKRSTHCKTGPSRPLPDTGLLTRFDVRFYNVLPAAFGIQQHNCVLRYVAKKECRHILRRFLGKDFLSPETVFSFPAKRPCNPEHRMGKFHRGLAGFTRE